VEAPSVEAEGFSNRDSLAPHRGKRWILATVSQPQERSSGEKSAERWSTA